MLTTEELAIVQAYACHLHGYAPRSPIDQDRSGRIFIGSDYVATQLGDRIRFDRERSESVTLTIEEVERCI